MSTNDPRKGKIFERRVGSLFALLGFSVEIDVLVGGRQVDLLLEDRRGPLSQIYIVECKDQAVPVNTAQYDAFRGRLQAARREINAKIRGVLVSSVGFVKEARAQNEHDEGIELLSISDLETRVIDFRQYVRNLVEENRRDRLPYFVEPKIRREYQELGQPAFAFFQEWLADPVSNHLTLLGDYGTGKTTLLKHLSYMLAERYQQDVFEGGARARVPIYIDLRDYLHAISLKQIILDFLD
ncbi:MAG TPA: restriction endonuclease, partial [Longimicrobium sp.]|nr:restriction endonuclease [Longimicrobium sp.]